MRFVSLEAYYYTSNEEAGLQDSVLGILYGDNNDSMNDLESEYAAATAQERFLSSDGRLPDSWCDRPVKYVVDFKAWLIKEKGFRELQIESRQWYVDLEKVSDAKKVSDDAWFSAPAKIHVPESPKETKTQRLDRLGYRFSPVDPPETDSH